MSLATERRPKAAPRMAKAAKRYRPGKLPEGIKQLADSDESGDEQQEDAEPADVPIGSAGEDEDEDLPVHQVQRAAPAKKMNLALRDVDISRDGKVVIAGKQEVGRTGLELQQEEESEEEEEAQPGEEEESSEEESSEEDNDVSALPAFRPVFVPKRARDTVALREAESEFSEEVVRKRELEAEERKKQSQEMVADSIKRELAEKEVKEAVPDVDDTDGLDPEGEFEAWRLRELARIKRDKEEELRKEEERAEIERRRALPEEQRLKEDLEHAEKLRAEKPKGQQKFLQKYWHKGAFHQDESILKKHDYTEATESTVDVTLLPKVMQVKNFGKRSQTKYTHLLDQDTTAKTGGFGGAALLGKPGGPGGASGSGCFICGGPHLKKDCPQLARGAPTSANSAPLGGASRYGGGGPSRYNDRDDPRGGGYGRDRERDRDRDDDRGEYRGRDYDRDKARYYESERRDRERERERERVSDRPRSRSRSRTPPRRRYDEDMRRKDRRRSRSRSASPSYRDKRRRVD
ncbi:hypothetical protein AURDEDRAFT_132410 [Auricularia subglabra TFB-10046 SS5]|nr:hypothetical protein AURDEDRAFT_132410 [Auricularia subglabra TFB-10046 SS5]